MSDASKDNESHDEKLSTSADDSLQRHAASAFLEAPRVTEANDEKPSILACDALQEMQTAQDAGNSFEAGQIARLRYFAGLPYAR